MSTKKIKRPRNTANIEFIERKSVFIGFSTFVENEEQALEIIKQKKINIPMQLIMFTPML